MKKDFTRVGKQIRAKELRVIDENGDNIGVLPLNEALKRARDAELDLIEISPQAKPPVAKIMDYGKYQYDQKKKAKAAKAKAHTVEVKTIQIKVGTSPNDLKMKANKITEWLNDGDRVKVELFLPGRLKYMDKDFLKERLDRVLKLIETEYNVAEPSKKSPKGMTMIIESSKSKN